MAYIEMKHIRKSYGNKEIVMKLLVNLQKEKRTILMVSHDDDALKYCSRTVQL